MEFYENHQQDEGGQELSQDDLDKERADDEGMTEQRVEEAENDPSVLATPTEIQQGGVSGGDPGNTSGGSPSHDSGQVSD